MASAADKKSTKPVIAYKAFGKDFSCRGFKFEVGKTYKHGGSVVICESGFHACANPLDVWNYYDLIDTRYGEVELAGEHKTHDEDSKIVAAEITIKTEITLPDFIRKGVAKFIELVAAGAKKKETAASGYSAQLAASGDSAQLAASGYSAQLAASGDSARLAASGDSARLAASGHSAKLAASGDYAQLAASGHSAKLAVTGKNGVIASASINGVAKGAAGAWISLAEFNKKNECIGFAVGCVGQDGIEPDTRYRAEGGKLVKVKE